jgi:CheY-like chemotaxis protein/HPt (histidine-containing phosphotransfer) domain-containing protein
VLVAEDNPVNQKVAVRTLEHLGCRADVVGDGAEAVEASLSGRYALVLMDCQMPVVDGYEATRAIRHREPAGRRTPIVAMTASAMEGDRERCLAVGMDDYVAKPFRQSELEVVLERWAGRATVATREPEHPRDTGMLDPVVVGQLLELDEAAGGGVLGELVELFVEDTPQRVRAIATAATTGDAEALRKAAHALKGSAGNVGAVDLAGVCARIEAFARDGQLSSARTLVGDVERRSSEAVELVVTALTGAGAQGRMT